MEELRALIHLAGEIIKALADHPLLLGMILLPWLRAAKPKPQKGGEREGSVLAGALFFLPVYIPSPTGRACRQFYEGHSPPGITAVNLSPSAHPAGMVAGNGIEPLFQGSEPCVLPLDDPALFVIQSDAAASGLERSNCVTYYVDIHDKSTSWIAGGRSGSYGGSFSTVKYCCTLYASTSRR